MKKEVKLFIRSIVNVSGKASKVFAGCSLAAFLIGVGGCLLLDRDERKEFNNRKNNK